MSVLFYISAAVAIAGSLMMVTRRNAMHGLVNLIVAFLAIACVFWTLGAPFVAALQIVVYAGAILVLFVFAMMILNLKPEAGRQGSIVEWIIPGILVATLLAQVIFVLTGICDLQVPGKQIVVGPEAVGESLFTVYALGAEIASVLLMAGLAAAFHYGAFSGQGGEDE
ncbi:MAG: NADH-quinone oxidoreductase subunit J [Armatimonadetes bacterium]|nr:NADH-quinone oxidoreductase subunit J [Armatimonadota bacterium]